MPSTRAKINDYITRSFRDVADDDYVAARALYRLGLDPQFLWSALQAVEKYLKATLLYHRMSTKNLGHDISRALEMVRSVSNPKFKIPGSVDTFVKRLGSQGIDRYFERPFNTDGLGLLELDEAVWHLRKSCRSVATDENMRRPIDGRLEEILRGRSRAREDLLWKNLYLGRYKRIRFSRRLKWANPSNFIYPKIFPELDKLIQFSKPVRNYFLRFLDHGAAKQRRQSSGVTGARFELPSNLRARKSSGTKPPKVR